MSRGIRKTRRQRRHASSLKAVFIRLHDPDYLWQIVKSKSGKEGLIVLQIVAARKHNLLKNIGYSSTATPRRFRQRYKPVTLQERKEYFVGRGSKSTSGFPEIA